MRHLIRPGDHDFLTPEDERLCSMFMATHLVGFGAGGGAATLSFVGNTIDSSAASTYTFSSHAIGAAAADRQVVVAVVSGSNASRTVDSVTVGGTGLSEIIEAVGGTTMLIALYAGLVTTGDTADIVVTLGGGTEDALQIGVWAMYGAAVGASATATNEDTPPAAAIAIPAGGVAVGASANDGTAGATWTNATERYDEQVETVGGNVWGTGADNTTGGGTTPTITADHTTESSPVLVLAAWAPA